LHACREAERQEYLRELKKDRISIPNPKVLSAVQHQHKSGDKMIFISLGKFRKKPTKAMIAESTKVIEQGLKETGAKLLGFYWTLGRYDSVLIIEGKDEKTYMKWTLRLGDIASSETLVAVSREEAIKLLE
jgi:uncharacterized protein with GYD domain